MKTKTLIPFHMLIIASLACNTIQGVIPETVSVDQSSPQAPQTVEIASPTAAPSIEAEAPQTPANNPLAAHISYPIVDSGQIYCYDDSGGSQPCPASGSAFYGQDAQYSGYAPSYTDNGDGTISDNVTGLIWQADPGAKMSYAQAVAGADSFTVAGYDDWRLPTIKELYSLILFSGYDVSGVQSDSDTSRLIPFIDDSFAFEYGDTSAGQRIIDSQWATSSIYTDMVFGRQEAMFGVNFADGRIKGYPTSGGQNMGYFVIYVRGNPAYGINDFVDNGNPSTGSGQVGTISDHATGLTWTQDDSGSSTGSEQGGMDWQAALNYCASLETAGISDWRLPNVKELQSIVDYSRAPSTTNSAAIDPLFNATAITNEAEQTDYASYWSSTTHANMQAGGSASYVSFGRSMGYMNGQWMDVHGAGAQRSDPKSGDPAEWPTGHGPQGDAVRINNYVRCVTGGVSSQISTGGEADTIIHGNGAGQNSGQPGQGQGPGGQSGPPQVAIDACTGSSAGATCTVNAPNGNTINGTCTLIQTQLACVPEGGLPPSGGQP